MHIINNGADFRYTRMHRDEKEGERNLVVEEDSLIKGEAQEKECAQCKEDDKGFRIYGYF